MQLCQQLWSNIDEAEELLWDLALRIHAHPELSLAEVQASTWLADVLEQHGFHVSRGVGNLPTAFRAEYPTAGTGPTLAIMAEYDALPELGHACGHNLIAAIAIGAGLGLAPLMVDLPGRLIVLGTPAEEGGDGKVKLIRAGLFRDIDAALMVHPSAHTCVTKGLLSVTEVAISSQGKASHASASPEDGINALDAVIQTFNGLNALRQHIRDGARIHGIITNGGQKPNIVPERAAASFYVRAADNTYRDELLAKLERCAQGAALATGATLRIKTGHSYKSMCLNRTMAEAFRKHIEELGYPNEEPCGGLGSSDVGDVSWEVPAIQPEVRITAEDTPLHSREFAEAACSPLARKAMIAAAKAIAATCLDIWTQPELYRQIRQEFDQRPV